MLALGLIETRGLVGAIEAADAMLKAANVRLLEKSLASGGLVTITVAGEVAAVQSAVDAAVASISRIHGVVCVSRHVIPRPDAELAHVLLLQPTNTVVAKEEEEKEEDEIVEEVTDETSATAAVEAKNGHANSKKLRHGAARKEKE